MYNLSFNPSVRRVVYRATKWSCVVVYFLTTAAPPLAAYPHGEPKPPQNSFINRCESI